MNVVNQIMGGLFDGLLFPFRSVSPMVAIVVLSLPIAIGMLYVFKKTSNQDRISRVKAKIQACIYEIRLFNDDMRAILRAQLEILRHNAQYVGLSLVPMVWMILPFVLIMAQLQSHYGWDGLQPGEPVLLKVQMAEGWENNTDVARVSGSGKPQLQIELPEGIALETPAVWIPSLRELDWRISAAQIGEYEICFAVGSDQYTKKVYVGDIEGARSPKRQTAGFVHQLLYPAEPSLPSGSPIRSIDVAYPDRTISVFGLGMHWLIPFFILSLIFAFALKGRFGVTI